MANKVLEYTNGESGGPFALQKTGLSAHQVSAQFDLFISQSSLDTMLTAGGGFAQTGSFLYLAAGGSDSLYIVSTGGDWLWASDGWGGAGSVAFTPDTWVTVKADYDSATDHMIWSADGTTVLEYDGSLFGGDVNAVWVGVIIPFPADVPYYFDNVRIGTTSGGSDILEDTFGAYAISASWSSTLDSYSIVNDPTATAAVISGIEFRRDVDLIFNSVLSTPNGIADADMVGQTVQDASSIAAYGTRSTSFEGLLTESSYLTGNDDLTETKVFATYYVNNYKDPRTRVDRVELRTQAPDGAYGPSWWAFALGVEIGDLVTLTTSHPGGGGFGENFYVEGIHYEAVPMTSDHPDVTLTLDLSPQAYYLDGTGVT